MYKNDTTILIDASKVVNVEINSNGHPGKFTAVHGAVKISNQNPPEMHEAARMITAWINEMATERFQPPQFREFKDTLGMTNYHASCVVYLTISHFGLTEFTTLDLNK